MQSRRHEVVHHVIFAGDRGEHAGDAFGFFFLVYGFKTEVGGLVHINSFVVGWR
jgi:hypothetical protein